MIMFYTFTCNQYGNAVPAANVPVKITRNGVVTTHMTDSNGKCTIEEGAPWSARATLHPDYYTERRSGSGCAETVNIGFEKKWTTHQGYVRHNGKPVTKGYISCHGERHEINAYGHYGPYGCIDWHTYGSQTITIEGTGYPTKTFQVALEGDGRTGTAHDHHYDV